MLVFQTLQLLDNTIYKCISVKDEATVISRDKELHCKLGQLIRKTLHDSALVFPLGNPDTCS